MAKKKSSSKRSSKQRSSSGGGAAAANKNKRDQDDAFLEEAIQLAAAEKKAMDVTSHTTIIPILSIEAIILLSNDVLASVSSFLLCKDMFYLSLTCKQMTAAIEDVALTMIGAAKVRYGGGDNTLSALQKMKLLLHSPIEFTDLVGKNL
eukprot:scaffold6271_cov67-Skeletonema_dohrnii-CCMP3373.AAC.1